MCHQNGPEFCKRNGTTTQTYTKLPLIIFGFRFILTIFDFDNLNFVSNSGRRSTVVNYEKENTKGVKGLKNTLFWLPVRLRPGILFIYVIDKVLGYRLISISSLILRNKEVYLTTQLLQHHQVARFCTVNNAVKRTLPAVSSVDTFRLVLNTCILHEDILLKIK